MTIIYLLIILLQVCVIIYFVWRGRIQARRFAENDSTPPADTYEGLRILALQVTPYQLKLAIPDSQILVYGVVMDWNTGGAIVTLATYITGAANLYLNTGGGVSGGGKNPNVGEAAVSFVTLAQDYIDRAIPATIKDLPPAGCVRFYLLTNKQIYAAQEQVKYFNNNSSVWLPLFKKGNEVITEMKSSTFAEKASVDI